MLLDIALYQCEKVPGQLHRLQSHAAVFELRLFRQRVEGGQGEAVYAPLEKTVTKMHRQEGLARTYAVVTGDRHDHRAAAAFQADQIARLQAMPAQLIR